MRQIHLGCFGLYLLSLVLSSGLSLSSIHAQENRTSADLIRQVVTHIKKVEPLERFDGKKREVQIPKALVVDLGDDQVPEVIVWIKPVYHQTPPIFIYQVPDKNTVYRLREALAPGPLQDFDGTYLDVHRTGKAADTRISTTLPMERVLLIANYLRMKSHVVAYPSFFHIEQGTDTGYYLDLTGAKQFDESDRNSCRDFQFSVLDDITYGRLAPNTPEVFLAKSGDTFYIYQIIGLNQIGLFEKKTTQAQVPADFIGFDQLTEGIIRYRNKAGEKKMLMPVQFP